MQTDVINETLNKKMRQTAIAGSVVGTIIEWYSYFLYLTASALVFPKLFFSSSDPYVSTLLSFGAVAIGFCANPIGAAIFGHFGDRIGRKKSLVYTLWLMGISSFLIGVLPTYDQIGFWAPIMLVLLRVLQGAGAGGEWGGAVLLSMEWGNKKSHGFAASLPNAGVGAGMLVSSAVMALCVAISGDGFFVWGWRLPFIFAVILLVVGLVIRAKVEETPSFREVERNEKVAKMPVLEVFRTEAKQIILAMLAKMNEHASFTIIATFMISYCAQTYGTSEQLLLNAVTVASIIMCFLIPFFGYLSDKVGIKRLYLIGVAFMLIWAFPYIGLVNTGNGMFIFAATVLTMLPHNIQAGAQPALIAQSFPARLRYSGAALSSQLAALISGGIAPILCTYLIHQFGTVYVVGYYIAFTAVVSFVATSLLKKQREFALDFEDKKINAAG